MSPARTVFSHITSRRVGVPHMRRSTVAAGLLSALIARADDWPQWMGPNRDGRWNETGILQKFPAEGPKKLWTAPVGGGYTGPAGVGNKVYATDYQPTEGERANNPAPTAKRQGTRGARWLPAARVEDVWKHEYDCPYSVSYAAGPRCGPTVIGGKVFTLGAMGNLHVLDANTGSVVWSKDFKTDYKARTPTW